MVEKIKNSRVEKLVYPDGSAVLRDYTPRGQLAAVRYDADNDGLNLQLAASFTYDNACREVSRSHGNGLTTTRSYSRNDNLVTGIACTGIVGLTYTYDANKNRTAETDSILTDHSYAASYDNKDRLTGFDKSNYIPHDQTWTLSGEGDWTNTVLGGVSEDRTHNAAHEILTKGLNAVTHDDKGNITINANGQRYSWDYENLMASADINGDLTPDVSYVYDAGNRRIAKIANGTTTVFAYAGWRCVEECDATSTPVALRKFAFGSYLDEPLMMVTVASSSESLHFYHQNANYNVIALTDAAGSIADRIAYSSYGQIVMATNGSTGNPWLYTGQRHDSDTGLDYYKMRYYDSSLGRFVGRDPIASSYYLYTYVADMPTRYVDPYGLDMVEYNTYEIPYFDGATTGKDKTTTVTEKWGDYIAKDVDTGCCFDIKLNVQYTMYYKHFHSVKVTVGENFASKFAKDTQVIAAGLGVVALVSAAIPEPVVTKTITGVTGAAAVVVGSASAVAALFAESKEYAREDTGNEGYFYGYGSFTVLSYEVAFNKGKDCPRWYDIDFEISGGTMDVSPVVGSAPGFIPEGSNIANARPDPNAWDNWSDRVITASDTTEK